MWKTSRDSKIKSKVTHTQNQFLNTNKLETQFCGMARNFSSKLSALKGVSRISTIYAITLVSLMYSNLYMVRNMKEPVFLNFKSLRQSADRFYSFNKTVRSTKTSSDFPPLLISDNLILSDGSPLTFHNPTDTKNLSRLVDLHSVGNSSQHRSGLKNRPGTLQSTATRSISGTRLGRLIKYKTLPRALVWSPAAEPEIGTFLIHNGK